MFQESASLLSLGRHIHAAGTVYVKKLYRVE